MSYDVIVLGAGAAGILAAATAAAQGRRTLLVEKNARPGVKILMSGGTRCNLTQNTDKWGIVRAYGKQGNFLHSALATLDPPGLVKLIEDEGCPTKIEETGKIFPVSNRATDVLDALLKIFARSGAEMATHEAATRIERDSSAGFRVVTSRRELAADKLIVTVGGQSYPGSGTTGDGYAWARELGHTIVPPRPALVPLTTSDQWVRGLSGITVPDVAVRAVLTSAEAQPKAKPLDERRGSLLFTHFGLSGPVILDISRAFTGLPDLAAAELLCDFLPDLPAEKLDEELRQAAASDGKRHVAGILAERLPRRLVEALLIQVLQSGPTVPVGQGAQNNAASLAKSDRDGRTTLPSELRGAELSKAARQKVVQAIKAMAIPITGTRGFAKAEVTAGGVALAEVDSRTMESKLVPGLYFAGEILDLDGPIGGYNFQAAFSTGMLAGLSV